MRLSNFFLTLPKAEKNDWFDDAKLQDWLEGTQEITTGEIEQEEWIERQWYRNVVNDGDVKISRWWLKIAMFIEANRLQNDGNYSHHRFYNAELKSGLKKETGYKF